MEEKILEVTITNYKDDYEDTTSQSCGDEANEDVSFWVHNLNECPEDAIIGRDLFDAYDYVRALKKGMELAKKGYTDIKIKRIDEDEERI